MVTPDNAGFLPSIYQLLTRLLIIDKLRRRMGRVVVVDTTVMKCPRARGLIPGGLSGRESV